MKGHRCFRAAVIVPFALSLFACSEEKLNKKLVRYIEDVKARPAKAIEPIPKLKPLRQYNYPHEKGRRDPFKMYLAKTPPKKLNGPDRNRTKQALEAYPLDALHMVGVLKQGGKIWGLVSTPKGAVYRVRVGDYLGKNYGKITTIKNHSIRVLEMIRVTGQWERKSAELKLNNKD